MGGRASVPRGPDGASETSLASARSPQTRSARRLSPRTVLPALSILTLGSLFYIYSRTTVSAAKENARRAREADGGSISWRREGLRRHGRLDKVEERGLWAELRGKGGKGEEEGEEERKEVRVLKGDENPIEEGIRRARQEREKARREYEQRRENEDPGKGG